MLYKKVFDYKGQAVRYFNKVVQNPKIESCCRCYEAGTGYVVYYSYKQNA